MLFVNAEVHVHVHVTCSEWDYTIPKRNFYESCPRCLLTVHDNKTANYIVHNNTNKILSELSTLKACSS